VPTVEISGINCTDVRPVRQNSARSEKAVDGVHTSTTFRCPTGGSAQGLWHGFSGEARSGLESNPAAPILRKGQVPVLLSNGIGRVRLKQPKGQVIG
jgi:hypothetical protein